MVQSCLVNNVILSLTADLYLIMSTQVQLVPGFQFAGQRLRYSTSPNSAANQMSGHLVSIFIHTALSPPTQFSKVMIVDLHILLCSILFTVQYFREDYFVDFLGCLIHIHTYHLIESFWAVMIVWRMKAKTTKTVLCCIVYYTNCPQWNAYTCEQFLPSTFGIIFLQTFSRYRDSVDNAVVENSSIFSLF